ncbi:19017_t:CDS:10 [Cetraspora pellucida]|uniref:19017_t:CDS:1 n=1 Tax=Cetraspora pellucida TaxID=1433469 RepID=A0A9N8WLY9_9GLOM|nr:19017_t:CDS:10 [Cetraspora pellucida]
MTDSINSKDHNNPSLLKKLTYQRGWGKPDILNCRSSVFLTIVPILTFSTAFTAIICTLYLIYDINVTLPGELVGTVTVVVGLLLAFRTNHAYDRYYEGRKLFNNLCTLARNSTRTIWIGTSENAKKDREEKITYIKLVLAFVVATKHHLRLEFGTNYNDYVGLLPSLSKGLQRTKFDGNAGQDTVELGSGSLEDPNHPDNLANQGSAPDITIHTQDANESTRLLPKSRNQDPVAYLRGSFKDTFRSLRSGKSQPCDSEVLSWGTQDPKMSLPLEIVFHLGVYFEQLAREKRVESYRLWSILDQFIDILGNLERISNTPVPLAYRVHLKQAVTLYVWLLPFTLVELLGWLTIPVILVISFILFGVEAIGSEIEDPFGYDVNDLPLDDYCKDETVLALGFLSNIINIVKVTQQLKNKK